MLYVYWKLLKMCFILKEATNESYNLVITYCLKIYKTHIKN